jgi:hypothetical protein
MRSIEALAHEPLRNPRHQEDGIDLAAAPTAQSLAAVVRYPMVSRASPSSSRSPYRER